MKKTAQTQVAIIGAGIVGLAQALAYSKRGYKVSVFERSPSASGASIRNFGMVWPIGQPKGVLLNRALRSKEIWLELAQAIGFYANPCGSLLVVNQKDEQAVAEEFLASSKEAGYEATWLNPSQTLAKCQDVNFKNLLGGLWSSTEVIIDPREAVAKIPAYLSEKYAVEFYFQQTVTGIAYPYLETATTQWKADKILLCSGVDFETLYPELFAQSNLTKCKLQMMRSYPTDFKLSTSLYGGLTLTHYKAFAHCDSLAALKKRIEDTMPEYVKYGIHVMICQNGNNELVIGDTHEYGFNPSPFDLEYLNDLVLKYLFEFVQLPKLQIGQRWHGVYAKSFEKTEWIHTPEEGVSIINGLGGAGMTLSFGLAEEMQSEI